MPVHTLSKDKCLEHIAPPLINNDPRPYSGPLEFFPELDASTQYATAFLGDRPIATLQRRRVYSKGPHWTLYKTDGTLLARYWLAPLSYEHLKRKTEKSLRLANLI